MPHPLVNQLRFTRSEFMLSVKGVNDTDARKRLLPMNCISWNIGHLAWQEQRYLLYFAQGKLPLPEINEKFAYGAPASTPPLKEVLQAWKKVTAASDPWLNTLTSEELQHYAVVEGRKTSRMFGNLLQRMIYHYWYHTGENMSIRQMLGHQNLVQFVGNIDRQAPYQPDLAVRGSRTKGRSKKK
jgi:DinB superfamily